MKQYYKTHTKIERSGVGLTSPEKIIANALLEKFNEITSEKLKPSEFMIVEGEISTYREFHHMIDLSIFY
ncbi:MAG: hypothetical protein WCV56_04545 [Candidatus Omnitrophota bacterium]